MEGNSRDGKESGQAVLHSVPNRKKSETVAELFLLVQWTSL